MFDRNRRPAGRDLLSTKRGTAQAGHPHGKERVPGDWELSMSKPNTRRVVRRVAPITIAGCGICLLLSMSAGQADAATAGQPSLLSGLTSGVSSGLQSVTDPVTGAVGSIVNSVTGTASTASQGSGSTTSQGSGSTTSQGSGSTSSQGSGSQGSGQPRQAAPTTSASS